MTQLRTEPRIPEPDRFYAAMLDAHRNLDPAASRRLDAKIIILLANHICDMTVLEEALAIASGAKRGE